MNRIEQSKVIKMTPTIIDVNYEDVVGKTNNDEMDWEESNENTEYVYDYYYAEGFKQFK